MIVTFLALHKPQINPGCTFGVWVYSWFTRIDSELILSKPKVDLKCIHCIENKHRSDLTPCKQILKVNMKETSGSAQHFQQCVLWTLIANSQKQVDPKQKTLSRSRFSKGRSGVNPWKTPKVSLEISWGLLYFYVKYGWYCVLYSI